MQKQPSKQIQVLADDFPAMQAREVANLITELVILYIQLAPSISKSAIGGESQDKKGKNHEA